MTIDNPDAGHRRVRRLRPTSQSVDSADGLDNLRAYRTRSDVLTEQDALVDLATEKVKPEGYAALSSQLATLADIAGRGGG
jgi:hypothetical protein